MIGWQESRLRMENRKLRTEPRMRNYVGGHLLAGNVWVRVDGGAAWPGLNKGFVSKPT